MHGIPHAFTALPYRKRGAGMMKQASDLSEDTLVDCTINTTKPEARNIRRISSFSHCDTPTPSPRPTKAQEDIAMQKPEELACKSSSMIVNGARMPPMDSTAASLNDSENAVPQTWIDLYHSRPNKILIEHGKANKEHLQSSPSTATKRWLQRVLAEVDPNVMVGMSPEKIPRI
jgi:hypothetical protein